MKLEIPYGDDREILDLEDERVEGVLWPNRVTTGDEASTLRRAVEKPLGSPGLDDFLRGREKVLIVVNDATRPTPTAEVLEVILPSLAGRRLQILVATEAIVHPRTRRTDGSWGNTTTPSKGASMSTTRNGANGLSSAKRDTATN
jgi:hypothetical protein